MKEIEDGLHRLHSEAREQAAASNSAADAATSDASMEPDDATFWMGSVAVQQAISKCMQISFIIAQQSMVDCTITT